MYEMDNDFNLIDVIDDPLSLNQFLEFPVYGSVESLGLDDVVQNATDEDFLNFDNCHLDYSSVDGNTTGAAEWNLPSTDLSSNVSSDFFDLASSSTVGDQTSIVTPVATLLQKCETIPQNLPLRCISASTSNCSTPQSYVQIQPSRNNVNCINQLSGTVIADSSVQRFHNANNRVIANFAVANSADNSSSFILNSSGSSTGGQVLMNVRPQSMVQNGPVRIQYIQVQNQLPNSMSTGTVVQSINATQLPTNNLKPVQLLQQHGQQLVTHGIQGGINLQGTIVPTAAGNRIFIRTGNNPPVPGQVGVQPMQICGSNFVGATARNVRLQTPQVIQQVTSVQQGVRAQHPQMTALVGRTDDAMVGQVIDANMSLSGGRQVVLQRTSAVSSQNLIYQHLPQQQAVTLPVNAIGSQENKLPDGLVVQIGGQTYRFEPSRQSTGAANVRQNTAFPQSQNVAFSDGGEILQDPVKMLQQNVQLQQVLLGNQINVLQMLQQQQQQQQRLQPKIGVQPYAGSQVTGSCDSVEVAPESSGTLGQTAFASQPPRPQGALDRTGFDPSIRGNVRVAPPPGLRPPASHPGLQLIQPKPAISVGMPCVSSAVVVGQPVNVLQLGTGQPLTHLGAQPTASNVNRNVVAVNVQPSAQAVTTLAGGSLQNPQNVQSVGGGQSQTVTAIRLSPDQQSLLVKIQSQMKTLLDLPKRNPDQEKYLQMLVSGQQRIISQGASQYMQQQQRGTAGVRTETGASGGNQPQQQQQQQNVVTITQPPASAESGSLSKISTVNSVACVQTATSAVSSVNAVANLSASSNLQRSGNVKAGEDLFQSLPHLKEKLEAHMAKMSPEQRQWFAKNQSLVFAKLQQHHHLLLEQDKKDPPPLQQQPLASSKQQQQNSSDSSSSSGSAATRVIRSLHLTRAQKFHLYLQKDQKRATHPEYSKTFENFKDVIRGLVPYHVFQTREPSDEEIATVEETFEEKSREMLERKDGMLRKYRLLLMEESMRPQLTSEMVLLERAFHSDEKTLLMNEKQQAEEDPDSFVPRPVLKRLKVDDELVKKEEEAEEEESADCKDKQLTCCAEDVTELTDVKVEAASLGANIVKLEHSSCPSSPLCPLRSSSSIERYKSLEIKLEKLDDADVKLAKCSNKIGKFDTTPKDDKSLNLLDSDNHPETNSCFVNSENPVSANVSPLRGAFSEDDVAVASLLNTESLKDASRKSDERYTTKSVNNDVAATSGDCNSGLTFDKGSAGTLADPANAGLDSLSFANIANLGDYRSDYVSFEREGDDLMRGTIDSLMADLTQFNYDLNNSSWGAGEPKGGDAPGAGSRQATAENTSSQRGSGVTGGGERSTESLQYEMQCAIDSIIQLQQPWSEEAGMASDPAALTTRVKNKESGVGGSLGKF